MTEYTPTDDHMRSLFCQGYAQGDFDKHDQAWIAWEKWLAAHDARVRRDAAREALDGLARKARADWHPYLCGWVGAVDDYRDAHYPEETP